MRAILGIDAAWTEHEPSGVALIHGDHEEWTAVSVAPSYDSFVAASKGVPVDWSTRKFAGSPPQIRELVEAARRFTPAELCVVAVDMPMATISFETRREADSAISKAFGGRGCATHSPNAARPGTLGASLSRQLSAEGIPLATTSHVHPDLPRAIEVYPHPALLALLGRDYRVPYKVSKSIKYWKGTSIAERIARLLVEFREIQAALELSLGKVPIDLPGAEGVTTLSSLKSYEDALDAVVCAWVGMHFVNGTAAAYGDDVAAIWVPA
jgi:predicted RNase H-like nuclease